MKITVKKLFLLFVPVIAFLLTGAAGSNIAKKSKDNKKVDALLSKMTLDEKIGQMLQVDSDALDSPEDVKTYCIGSILSG
ncbi:MAG: hypothetical protein ACM3MI_04180, partial [Clostridiales bacterium]